MLSGGAGLSVLGGVVAADEEPVGTLPAVTSGVNAVAFSPDRVLLATANTDGTVRLWNPSTGQPVAPPLLASIGR